MTTSLYGLSPSTCDTMKKAVNWIKNAEKPYVLHDYRKDGLSQEMLVEFVQALGWEALINKRGTTYRSLTDEQKQTLNEANAIRLMLESPALIKRPLLIHNDHYHLGFKPDQYQAIFK